MVVLPPNRDRQFEAAYRLISVLQAATSFFRLLPYIIQERALFVKCFFHFPHAQIVHNAQFVGG